MVMYILQIIEPGRDIIQHGNAHFINDKESDKETALFFIVMHFLLTKEAEKRHHYFA